MILNRQERQGRHEIKQFNPVVLGALGVLGGLEL
jgi:hypothetical protein